MTVQVCPTALKGSFHGTGLLLFCEKMKRLVAILFFTLCTFSSVHAFYDDKLYTGGIGAEVFVGTGSYLSLELPLQIKFIVITPAYGTRFSNTEIKKYGDRGENEVSVSFGLVPLDFERFKAYPYAGFGSDWFMFGAHAEWRFRIGDKDRQGFNMMDYESLIFKYMGDWTPDGDFQNKFMLGLGIHLW